MGKKWHHPRALRMVFADYIAKSIGLARSEAELAFICAHPEGLTSLWNAKYYQKTVAKRIETAIEELEREKGGG